MDGRELCFLLKSRWVDYIYLEQEKKKKRITCTLEILIYLQENYKNTLIDTFLELASLQGLRALSPILPSLLTPTSSSRGSPNHPQVQ